MKSLLFTCALITALTVSAQSPFLASPQRNANAYFPDVCMDFQMTENGSEMYTAQEGQAGQSSFSFVPEKNFGFDPILLPSGLTIIGVRNANDYQNFEEYK